MTDITVLGTFIPSGWKHLCSFQPSPKLDELEKQNYLIFSTSNGIEELFIFHGDQHIPSQIQSTVIWSIGECVQKCITVPFYVTQALSNNFINNNEFSTPGSDALNQNICILDRDGSLLKVYNNSPWNGQDYTEVLPCKMRSMWKLPFGILLQSNNSVSSLDEDTEPKPSLFSLMNPLEEVRPVAHYSSRFASQKVQNQFGAFNYEFFCANDEDVVFSSDQLPVVITFNTKTKSHTFWHVRIVPLSQQIERTYESAKITSGLADGNIEQSNLDQTMEMDIEHQIGSDVFLEKTFEQPGKASDSCWHNIFIAHDHEGIPLVCALQSQTNLLHLFRWNNTKVEYCGNIPASSAIPLRGMRFLQPSDTSLSNLSDILVLSPQRTLAVFTGSQKIYDVALPSYNNNPIYPIELCDYGWNQFNIVSQVNSSVEKLECKLDILPCSELVCNSLQVIDSAVPFPVFASLLGSILQNTTNRDPEAQWNHFQQLLLGSPQTHEGSPTADWDFLLQSSFHQARKNAAYLKPFTKGLPSTNPAIKEHTLSPSSNLPKEYLPSIAYLLHLVYEDYKLNTLKHGHLKPLAQLLVPLCKALGWFSFVKHYTSDFPNITAQVNGTPAKEEPLVPDVLLWVWSQLRKLKLRVLSEKPSSPAPLPMWVHAVSQLRNVCQLTHKICNLFFILTDTSSQLDRTALCERVVLEMVQHNISLCDLDHLPIGLSIPLQEAIRECRLNPRPDWDEKTYALIGREDMIQRKTVAPISRSSPLVKSQPSSSKPSLPQAQGVDNTTNTTDGTELENAVSFLRFNKDRRISNVQQMLTSSRVLLIHLSQTAGTTENDQDTVAEQQERLTVLAKRTLALSVGRGMFTLATSQPILTEPVHIPPIVLNGRIASTKLSVSLDMSTLAPDTLSWPEFHNGVAAGLRIAPEQAQITSTWIVYNKPVPDQLSNSHAGVLMALGLQGHLSVLALTKVFDYLSASHEITSVGLLLGMAATKRGTMDASISKVLSVHVPSLHPPSSTDLEVHPNIQTAALLGIGLLYQETAHRRMTEVLLSEIGRKPTDQNGNRECYALAAGLGLGLVTLGRGTNAVGLADLQIEDKLSKYIDGGKDTLQDNASKDTPKSVLVLEGNQVNVHVTASGAILALGLMFLKTNNKAIASRLAVPTTNFLLDFARPDLILLRIVARNLIMWDSIQPTEEWVQSQIPPVIQRGISNPKKGRFQSDMEVLKHARINILAGACFSLGLRYAGTGLLAASELVLRYLDLFQQLQKKNHEDEDPCSPAMIETCLNVVAVSAAMIMAGTGDLQVLRVLRKLRKRNMKGMKAGHECTYGNHMAIHMALGLLFLGGGRYTLSTSNTSIAALVCSLYPQFPSHTADNRYHLQALRHLYVLATEPRCIEVRDTDLNTCCSVPLEIVLKHNTVYNETKIQAVAPCLLPEYDIIESISVVSPFYWNHQLSIERFKRESTSKRIVLFIKRKDSIQPNQSETKHSEKPQADVALSHIAHSNRTLDVWCRKIVLDFYDLWDDLGTKVGYQQERLIHPTILESFNSKKTALS